MPSASFSSILAAATLAASAATVFAQSPLPSPQFTAILTGQLNTTAQMNTTGPFGTHIHIEATGGDLLNVTTGEVVGTVLSFADNGVTASSGLSFPSTMMPLTWSDGHFASMSLNGVGSQNSNVVWSTVHVETDSPTYSWMNGQFLIMQTDTSNMGFTIYEETSLSSEQARRVRRYHLRKRGPQRM